MAYLPLSRVFHTFCDEAVFIVGSLVFYNNRKGREFNPHGPVTGKYPKASLHALVMDTGA